MKVEVTARHMEVTDLVKDYAYEKVERLEKFFDNIRKMEVILDKEKTNDRYTAEMIASATKGQVLVCHSTDVSATAALDMAADKMERQLSRFKEKLRKRTTDSVRRP